MKVKVMMATTLAALVMLSGCGSAPAASSEVETYSSAMQLVTLTDDEMLASIQEAAKELQKNINKTDETAKVDVEVDKDGKCIVYASGRDENGNATTRQELCKADTIKDMLSLFEKPEGECLHRISFAEFADKVTKTTRIQGEWVDEIPVFEPGDDYGQYTWNKCERI